MVNKSTKRENSGTAFDQKIERYKKMASQNKRRAALGVRLNIWESEPASFFGKNFARYNKGSSSALLGMEHLKRSEVWKLLRRAKSYLARRVVDESLFDELIPAFRAKHPELRGVPFPLLDYFPGLKFSYSSTLPASVVARNRGEGFDGIDSGARFIDLCVGSSSKKAHVSDLMRSHSIRLDPVDAPKQLFLYRLRIRRCIDWAYSVGLVPIMMTLTIFHRWHPLKGLLTVLRKAWNYFFTGTRMAVRRSEKMGLVAYIRRAEETINNISRRGDDDLWSYNSGWHPHYHVILFIRRDKLDVVSGMEDELREAWFQAVNRFFEMEFGEPIDSSYEASFKQHGLRFSRCVGKGFSRARGGDSICFGDNDSLVSVNKRSRKRVGKRGVTLPCSGVKQRCGGDGRRSLEDCVRVAPLRHVDDSDYLAKIFGCETGSVYGGDSELTGGDSKNSRVPFDLLCDDTAENVDLWVEYALATKGVMSFFFSRRLEQRVDDYFREHPEQDPVKPFSKERRVLARISHDTYHFMYRVFKVDEMLKVAVKGVHILREWCRQVYISHGYSSRDITDDMLPYYPGDSRRQMRVRVDNGAYRCVTEDKSTGTCVADDGDTFDLLGDDVPDNQREDKVQIHRGGTIIFDNQDTLSSSCCVDSEGLAPDCPLAVDLCDVNESARSRSFSGTVP